MIVKNEESTLGRCLESVKGLFDEVIIVDTGSIDRTCEVALSYIPNGNLYSFEWRDDFSAARNFAFSKASSDYAMWIDADDVIPSESRQALADTISELSETDADMVFMPYSVAFDENGAPSVSFERERIIRLGKGYLFEGAVHEAIPPAGRIIHSAASISHLGKEKRETGRNLRILSGLAAKRELSARECYYYARELSWAEGFDLAEFYYKKCIADPSAWSENKISSCIELAEMYRKKGETELRREYLMRSLEYGTPRADMCCMLGSEFLSENKLDIAAFWYLLAVTVPKSSLSFVPVDYFGYIPYIQLAVIYDKKGLRRDAGRYNELAGGIKPAGREYLYNKKYFESLE